MDLIIGHDHADFDALASQVAARKLYPGARLVTPGSVGREVHPYLGLHRDRFPLTDARQVEWQRVQRVVLVDTRSMSRLNHVKDGLSSWLERGLPIHIFDHHSWRDDDIAGEVEVVEPVGSTTSLLVERLRQGELTLDGVEATLCALGLHTDTGSLTFANSTHRDAEALSWLMRRGAQLSVLNRYLHAPFSSGQRLAITQVLQRAEEHALGGLRVGIANIELEGKLNGLDEVTSRALDTLGFHALFGVYTYARGRTAVIARARSHHLHTAEILKSLGGGGHGGAASAMVHDKPPQWVVDQVLASLQAHPPQAEQVCDVMSSPVHRVARQEPLSSVAERLAQWGHSGLCVMQDGKLCGVISHRDVERARSKGRLHLPASSHMTQNPRTCGPESPLETALQQMERHNIGRLPVLEGARLVGIVTRADLVRTLYQDAQLDGSATLRPGAGTPSGCL